MEGPVRDVLILGSDAWQSWERKNLAQLCSTHTQEIKSGWNWTLAWKNKTWGATQEPLFSRRKQDCCDSTARDTALQCWVSQKFSPWSWLLTNKLLGLFCGCTHCMHLAKWSQFLSSFCYLLSSSLALPRRSAIKWNVGEYARKKNMNRGFNYPAAKVLKC